jgi:hypothetical protein
MANVALLLTLFLTATSPLSTQVQDSKAAQSEPSFSRLAYCFENYAGSKDSSITSSLKREYKLTESEPKLSAKALNLTVIRSVSMMDSRLVWEWSFEVRSTFKLEWEKVEAVRVQRQDPLSNKPRPNAIYIVFKDATKPNVEVPEEAKKIKFYEVMYSEDSKRVKNLMNSSLQEIQDEEQRSTLGIEILFTKTEQLEATANALKDYVMDKKLSVALKDN